MELNTFGSFFSGSYMPHGHCYLWQPHILWTNVISDFLIAVAYFSLPIAIMLFSSKRKDIGYNKVFILFSLFILFCGITHVISIFTIWHGIYGIHGVSKAITALVSILTAIYVYKLIPQALLMPTLDQFEETKKQLVAEQANVTALEFELTNQKFVKFVLDGLPVSTLVLNNKHQVIFFNQTFINEFQPLIEGETTSSSIFELVELQGDTFTKVSLFLNKEDTETNAKLTVLTSLKTKEDVEVPIELMLNKSEFEGDSAVLMTIKNLTEMSQVKLELVESHQRLERAISATEDGIWEWDVKRSLVNYSPKLMELIGKAEIESPTFEDWFTHIHPDFRDKVQEAIKEHFSTQEIYSVEYLGLDKEGKYRWFASIGNTSFNEQGEPEIMSGSLRNIELTKNLEKLNQEKSEFLDVIFKGSSHAIWVMSVQRGNEFCYEEFNPTACNWTSTEREEVIGRTLGELTPNILPLELATRLREYYLECVRSHEKVGYIDTIPLNGSNLWFSATLYPILDEHGNVTKIVGTALDITLQKESELELEKNKHFLEKIFDSTVCGLYLYDLKEHTNTKVNQRYTDLLGYNMDELNSVDDFQALFHPDDREKVLQHIAKVVASESGQLMSLTYRFMHKEGHWVWCHSLDCIVKYDSEGQAERMLGTFVDVTEQTVLLQKLKESNEYLERFAFVASHDLQEPLRKIIAFSGLLSHRIKPLLQDDSEAEFQLERLNNAAHRMQSMIKDILKLSRINTTASKIVECNLNIIIDDVKDQLSELVKQYNAEIIVEGGSDDFYADPSLMAQLFQNLIGNAIKFSTPNVLPEIVIKIEKLDTCVEISCQDNGIGIEEDYLQHIFEPFRRLHSISEYSGSGIGLAICQQVMKVHGGTIECQSQKGQGSLFILTLPRLGATYG